MNDDAICDPPPEADVDGFTFHRDQHEAIIARCLMCKIGFVVTAETATAMRANMLTHLDAVHDARS